MSLIDGLAIIIVSVFLESVIDTGVDFWGKYHYNNCLILVEGKSPFKLAERATIGDLVLWIVLLHGYIFLHVFL